MEKTGNYKGCFVTIITSLMLLGLVSISQIWAGINQWTSHGPEGGFIIALAIDPNNSQTLYTGTDGGGVFKTTNGGTSWVAVNSGLTNTSALGVRVK